VRGIASGFLLGALRRKRRQLLYWGRRHRCPVCRASTRLLLPEGQDHEVLRELDVVGGEYRAASSCPVCFANSRSRLLWYWLEHESGVFEEPLEVLHLAPEFGIYWRLSGLPDARYRPLDLTPERYAYAGPVTAGDLTALPLPDESVDLLLANHVLEHVEDDSRALLEIRRVLHPGGTAVLQVPIARKLATTREDSTLTAPEDRERAYGQRDHVRLYGHDYYERLERAGFEVELYAAPDSAIRSWQLNPRERLPLIR